MLFNDFNLHIPSRRLDPSRESRPPHTGVSTSHGGDVPPQILKMSRPEEDIHPFETFLYGESPTIETFLYGECHTTETFLYGESHTTETFLYGESHTTETLLYGESPTIETFLYGENHTTETLLYGEKSHY